MTRWHAWTIALGLCLTLCRCVLVPSIDDVQPSRSETCETCHDAAVDAPNDAGDAAPQPQADSSPPVQRDAAMDSGKARGCEVPVRADCNPVTPCGCKAGAHCALDESVGRVHCVQSAPGAGVAGAPCLVTADCAAGLACSLNNVCSPYCSSDEDCHSQGDCVLARHPMTRAEVPGSGSCTRWCDPISNAGCMTGTSCYATTENGLNTQAYCNAIELDAGQSLPLGASCDSYYACAPTLSCVEYGPRMCTPFCRTDPDCPASAPHCYKGYLREAPGKPLGWCIVWPCDDTTLSAPLDWQGGPVWTAAELMACQAKCGGFSRNCFMNSCQGGSAWLECLKTTAATCAGARGGPCRNDYVASTCCEVEDCKRLKPAFDTCTEMQADCAMQAQMTCLRQAQN